MDHCIRSNLVYLNIMPIIIIIAFAMIYLSSSNGQTIAIQSIGSADVVGQVDNVKASSQHDNKYVITSAGDTFEKIVENDVVDTPMQVTDPGPIYGTDNAAAEKTDYKSRKIPRPVWKPPAIPRSMENYNHDAESWVTPKHLPKQLRHVDQADPELIEFIRNNLIIPPSKGLPLTLENPDRIHFSQLGQSEFLDCLLDHPQNGLFVDSGAHNGERNSNSLFFERERNWTGILIEPNPMTFKYLLKKHRRSYKINTCLSTTTTPVYTNFTMQFGLGAITHTIKKSKPKLIQPTQCLPVYSILKAMDLSHVDFWSLDVNGAELPILQTVPWTKMDIDVLSVEINSKETAILDHMKSYGYQTVDLPPLSTVQFPIDIILIKDKNLDG